jgi:hypothetical protein
VTSAATLLIRSGLTPAQARFRILYSADILPTLANSVVFGRLDVDRMLQLNGDAICPLTDFDSTAGRCRQGKWVQGMWDIGTISSTTGGFTKLKNVIIHTARGLIQIGVDYIMRITGKPNTGQNVFYFDFVNNMFQLVPTPVSDVTDESNRPVYFSGKIGNLTPLATVGDFVTRPDSIPDVPNNPNWDSNG